MRCNNCGSIVLKDAKACSACKNDIEVQLKARKKLFLILFIVSLLIMIGSVSVLVLIAPLAVFQIVIFAVACPLFGGCANQSIIGMEFVFIFFASLVSTIVFLFKYLKK